MTTRPRTTTRSRSGTATSSSTLSPSTRAGCTAPCSAPASPACCRRITWSVATRGATAVKREEQSPPRRCETSSRPCSLCFRDQLLFFLLWKTKQESHWSEGFTDIVYSPAWSFFSGCYWKAFWEVVTNYVRRRSDPPLPLICNSLLLIIAETHWTSQTVGTSRLFLRMEIFWWGGKERKDGEERSMLLLISVKFWDQRRKWGRCEIRNICSYSLWPAANWIITVERLKGTVYPRITSTYLPSSLCCSV